MPPPSFRFPAPQETFLRAFREGHGSIAHPRQGAYAVSLVEINGRQMPDASQQDLQGTCVAHAVVGLLEFFDDFRSRLSVQFLFTAAKKIEREGLERNLAHLRGGEPLDAAFEAVFHPQLAQLRMFADVNGGMGSAAMRPHLMAFENAARAHFRSLSGCLLASAFRAVETMGVCRHALWPAAATPATSVFGVNAEDLAFPPGTCEDARKRCVTHGLYLLPTPNNVDEIRGLLAGANGRRAMPVVVAVDFFANCDGATYTFPATEEDNEGHLISKNAWQGRHAVLLVGYQDDISYPGGGYFVFRNSLGPRWGDHGYGKLPYAYLECFAREAGTILQDKIDYEGDGYDGQRRITPPARPRLPLSVRVLANLAIGLVLVATTYWLLDHRQKTGTDPTRSTGTDPTKLVGTDPTRSTGTDPTKLVGTDPTRLVGTDPTKLAGTDPTKSTGTDPTRLAGTDPTRSTGTDPTKLAGTDPTRLAGTDPTRTVYKVFLSCADANERKALRNALASEGVRYPIEFLPQTLETVLSVRVTMPEGDAYEAVAEILKKYYEGPRREFWTDVAGLSRSRSIYIVKAATRKLDDGL